MEISGIKRSASRIAAAAAIALVAATPASALEGPMLRCEQHEGVVGRSSGGSSSSLETVRRECPLLGDIIEEFALQDQIGRAHV